MVFGFGSGEPSRRRCVVSTPSLGPTPAPGRFFRRLGRSPWVPDVLRRGSIRGLDVTKPTEKGHHLKTFHPACISPTGVVKHPKIQ